MPCLLSLVRRALLTYWHRRRGPARDSMPHQLRIRGMPAPGTRLRDMCYGRLPLRLREVDRLNGCFRVGDRLSGHRGRTGAEASHRECRSRQDRQAFAQSFSRSFLSLSRPRPGREAAKADTGPPDSAWNLVTLVRPSQESWGSAAWLRVSFPGTAWTRISLRHARPGRRPRAGLHRAAPTRTMAIEEVVTTGDRLLARCQQAGLGH